MAHVIITGGSSGIGLALAHIYLERGDSVSLIGRSQARLDAARSEISRNLDAVGERLLLKAVSVADAEAVEQAVDDCSSRFGSCDLLITSAGIVLPSTFDQLNGEQFAEQISTNLIGTANAVRAVYPAMKDRGSGTIVMVSSGAALIGLHGYTAYCASKSGLIGFAEALRMEAEPHGIHVAVAYPPDTDTPQFTAELPLRSAQAQRVMGRVRPWAARAVAAHMARSVDRRLNHIHFGASLALLGRFGPLIKPALYRWYLRDPWRRR